MTSDAKLMAILALISIPSIVGIGGYCIHDTTVRQKNALEQCRLMCEGPARIEWEARGSNTVYPNCECK